ncbi:MAG: aminotransferase class V-fold PLP-dependent enzyme [Candidatus Dojkabacteria bacterium]
MFEDIRKEFPILKDSFLKRGLVYLDSAATTQKPSYVIERLTYYYTHQNANIHRGPYKLSLEATEFWEWAHKKVASFINAKSFREVLFVKNTTEGLNMLVNTVGRELLGKDDIVVISEMEHHSNIVSWMLLQKEIPFKIEYIPVRDDYNLDIDWLEELIRKYGRRIKIISVVHISNVLGVKNNVKKICELGKKNGSFTIVDAAQSIAHVKVDVQDIGCDALVFSGHKVYAPTGTGVVYCKEEILDKLRPWMGGGEMISSVSSKGFEYNELPWKFEAGTPDIGGGIVLGYAIEWLEGVLKRVGGWRALIQHEQELIGYLLEEFDGIEWFVPFGPRESNLRYGAVAFHIKGFTFRGCKDVLSMETKKDGSSISKFLDRKGIAFREGYHCAEPLHDRFEVGPSLRFSFGIYNNGEDVKYAANALKEAVLSGN